MPRVLFVCSRNRLRSPTAEVLFASLDGLETSSAGTAPDAVCPLSADLLEWADTVLVMESRQKKAIERRFGLARKPILVLGIPDRYRYMQPELIAALRAKALPLLSARTPKERSSEDAVH